MERRVLDKVDPVRELVAGTDIIIPGTRLTAAYETAYENITFTYPDCKGPGVVSQLTAQIMPVIRKNKTFGPLLEQGEVNVAISDDDMLVMHMTEKAFHEIYGKKPELEQIAAQRIVLQGDPDLEARVAARMKAKKAQEGDRNR